MLEFSLFFLCRVAFHVNISLMYVMRYPYGLPLFISTVRAENTLSGRLIRSFTEHLLSFLFAASSWPQFTRQLPIDHSPNTYYVRAHQADQWHGRAHYFCEYQMGAENKSYY